jgi:hypothetical protein
MLGGMRLDRTDGWRAFGVGVDWTLHGSPLNGTSVSEVEAIDPSDLIENCL